MALVWGWATSVAVETRDAENMALTKFLIFIVNNLDLINFLNNIYDNHNNWQPKNMMVVHQPCH
ncbi:hypothetical protein [Nostoc sp.]|uniref:hypothetical protein n=1 Tax=Nostoc sp. TaxID=1180 RepID=UPI002FF4D6A8